MMPYEVIPEAGRFLVEVIYPNGHRQIAKIFADRQSAEQWLAQARPLENPHRNFEPAKSLVRDDN